MSLSVGTHFLIAHWGFPSFHLGHWHDWLDWSIILIGDSDIVIFFVLHWYICLRYLTCWLYWLIISCCLAHWSWFCHDYSDHFTCIHSPLYITQLAMLFSLTGILSWSSFEHDVHIAIHPDSRSFLCGHEWYILYFAWLYDAWLPSFCMIACCLSMWAAHISPYLQLSWFRSFLSSRFSLLQVWDLLCVCSLTEPEIRSRV